MVHLDLFSGIGGFAYAADQVFDDVTHVFCDNDKFCQAVLSKHWPESEIFDDIRSITADTDLFGRQRSNVLQQGRSSSRRSDQRVDLLTGGFPCQPFSAAGLRRGTADERHLWPEMLRVIRLTQPSWVIAENVSGILTWNDGLVFEQVCTDLETAGYEVQPYVIPAAGVNAPHRRDRVWFVAHAKHDGSDGAKNTGSDRRLQQQSQARPELSEHEPTGGDSLRATKDRRHSAATDAGRLRGQSGGRSQVRSEGQKPIQSDSQQFDERQWGRHWTEVAAEFCRVDDGLPSELGDLTLTKAQHRKEQLKAYGNAIVPQLAIQIMRSMALPLKPLA